MWDSLPFRSKKYLNLNVACFSSINQCSDSYAPSLTWCSFRMRRLEQILLHYSPILWAIYSPTLLIYPDSSAQWCICMLQNIHLASEQWLYLCLQLWPGLCRSLGFEIREWHATYLDCCARQCQPAQLLLSGRSGKSAATQNGAVKNICLHCRLQ